jgi:hypothetical protein
MILFDLNQRHFAWTVCIRVYSRFYQHTLSTNEFAYPTTFCQHWSHFFHVLSWIRGGSISNDSTMENLFTSRLFIHYRKIQSSPYLIPLDSIRLRFGALSLALQIRCQRYRRIHILPSIYWNCTIFHCFSRSRSYFDINSTHLISSRLASNFHILSFSYKKKALGAAAIDDLLAWCTLALALSYASGGSPINGLYTALIAIGFVLVLIFPVRKLLLWVLRIFREFSYILDSLEIDCKRR